MNTSHDKTKAVDSALTLFWRRGYTATSLKDLEKATGMHPGSIYASFGSKAKLYCQAMDRYVDWIAEARAELSKTDATALAQLADFVEHAHPVSNRNAPMPACFLVKTTLETGFEQPEIAEKLEALMDANDLLLERVFQAAIEQGELPAGSNAQDLADQLSADLAGLCFYALRHNDAASTARMASKLASRIRDAALH